MTQAPSTPAPNPAPNKEDDATPAWTGAVFENAAANPVTGVDPS